MESLSLRETIKQITEKHLSENNGILLGECVSDPGGVAGTIPEHENVVDLPMTETAGADFAVGCAIVGRRPIFVVRFQDFMLMNGSPFIAFAAVYKHVNNIPAPVFIRALANDHFDATHSNVLHSMFMHFPGFRVCAPITPGEYRSAWDAFMSDDSPMYVSEFRDTYNITEEFQDDLDKDADINIFAVSVCRVHAMKAKEVLASHGVKANVIHVFWLKPFAATQYSDILRSVPLGLVVEPGREICGACEHLAYELMIQHPRSQIYRLGLDDVVKTTNPKYYNEVPQPEKISAKVLEILGH